MRAKMSAARARAQTRGRRGRSAHLEDPSVEVACGLDDPARAQMAGDLEDTGEQEVDDDRVREVLPVAAARGGEYECRGACTVNHVRDFFNVWSRSFDPKKVSTVL